MTEHTLVKHEDCDKLYCQFCQGGISACTVCGGMEGSLTTKCCGRKLSEEERNAIYSKQIDFVEKWILK